MFLVCFWWYGGKCFNKGANKQSALKKNRNMINMIIVMCNRNMINMIIYPHSEQTYSIGLNLCFSALKFVVIIAQNFEN